jgi:hypothetical protein
MQRKYWLALCAVATFGLMAGCSSGSALTPGDASASPLDRWLSAQQVRLGTATGITLTVSVDLAGNTVTLSQDGVVVQTLSIPAVGTAEPAAPSTETTATE